MQGTKRGPGLNPGGEPDLRQRFHALPFSIVIKIAFNSSIIPDIFTQPPLLPKLCGLAHCLYHDNSVQIASLPPHNELLFCSCLLHDSPLLPHAIENHHQMML